MQVVPSILDFRFNRLKSGAHTTLSQKPIPSNDEVFALRNCKERFEISLFRWFWALDSCIAEQSEQYEKQNQEHGTKSNEQTL